MSTSIQEIIDTRAFNYYFKVGDEVQVDENIILNESTTCNLVKDHIGKKGIVRECHTDLHAYGRGTSYSIDVEFDGVLVKNIWAPLLVRYKGGRPQVSVTEKEIEKIGFDHDRDKYIIEEKKENKMTKEKKAMIGSIASIMVIIISFLIRPIGEFFVKLVVGTFVLGVGVLLIAIVYNAIYCTILDILNWLDKRKRNKE